MQPKSLQSKFDSYLKITEYAVDEGINEFRLYIYIYFGLLKSKMNKCKYTLSYILNLLNVS